MLELTRSLARLAVAEPDDPIVKKALRLLDTATRGRDKLSPVQRAYVGKTLALAVDAKTPRVSLSGGQGQPQSFLADAYDSFLATATAAIEYPPQAMLAIAQTIDRAVRAVQDGADDALLHTANALDQMQQAVEEAIRRLAEGIGRGVRAATWTLLGPALLVMGVLVAYGYARRGR